MCVGKYSVFHIYQSVIMNSNMTRTASCHLKVLKPKNTATKHLYQIIPLQLLLVGLNVPCLPQCDIPHTTGNQICKMAAFSLIFFVDSLI